MRTRPLPDDLVQARRAFTATYEALAASRPGQDPTALRRRLLRLSVRIHWHAYWNSAAGSADRARLREAARARVVFQSQGEVGGPPPDGRRRSEAPSLECVGTPVAPEMALVLNAIKATAKGGIGKPRERPCSTALFEP